jgi:hypothetical protein
MRVTRGYFSLLPLLLRLRLFSRLVGRLTLQMARDSIADRLLFYPKGVLTGCNRNSLSRHPGRKRSADKDIEIGRIGFVLRGVGKWLHQMRGLKRWIV